MFTLPPRPPKDYYLEDVPPTQQSGQEFTPDALPRVTQTNLGKFCAPIEGDDEEKPAEIKIQPILPSVLDRWMYSWRAYWVPKPGENAYYLHDVYKNHTVLVDPDYSPVYKHLRKKLSFVVKFVKLAMKSEVIYRNIVSRILHKTKSCFFTYQSN